jgi:hypothetical protein
VETQVIPSGLLIAELAGMLVIRPLVAVGGALWEGARDEVVAFGGDVAATFLSAVRHRLHISSRQIARSPHTGRFHPPPDA